MKENYQNMKIAVVGIGGVGGYLAAMLAHTYTQVTLIARDTRRQSINEKGLILHSDYHGEITVHPLRTVETAKELEPQDFIFICVKSYSLEEVCQTLGHCVADHTVIIPVMNGADPGDRVHNLVRHGTVVDSLIYILAFANNDDSVTQQGMFADIRIGIKNASRQEQEKVRQVYDLLAGADINCKCPDDIEREIWRKYILNCAYNVETAYYMNTIGELRSDPIKAKEYEFLVHEAYTVAKAKGVNITQDHVNSIIHRFYNELADNATSSLQRDIRDDKRTELDIFGGYLITEARRLGVKVPVSERMYREIKENVKL